MSNKREEEMEIPSSYRLFMSPLTIQGLMDTIRTMEEEDITYLRHWLATPEDLDFLRQQGEDPKSVGYWVLGRVKGERRSLLDS